MYLVCSVGIVEAHDGLLRVCDGLDASQSLRQLPVHVVQAAHRVRPGVVEDKDEDEDEDEDLLPILLPTRDCALEAAMEASLRMQLFDIILIIVILYPHNHHH